MRRFPLLIVICALAVFGLAACGGDDDTDTTTEPAATETTTTETTTTGGRRRGDGGGRSRPGRGARVRAEEPHRARRAVTFEFTNESSTPHDFVLEQDGEEVAKTDVITEGNDTAQATLEAGEYTFFCSVPGHRQAGMEGTLTAE